MFHVKLLKLWWPKQVWGTGWGDHIQLASVIPEWQMLNPGGRVLCAQQQMVNSEALLHIPGVELFHAEEPPEPDYIDAFNTSPWPPRKVYWDAVGVDWENKRYWYHVTPEEREYGLRVWSRRPRPWVVVQTTGGMASKRWAHWPYVAEQIQEEFNAGVLMLDPHGQYKGKSISRIGLGRVRDVMAIVATADMFVGWDSGPFYSAIGADVPSVGIFSVWKADWLYWPVTTPSTIPLECKPESLEPREVMAAVRDLMSHVVGRITSGEGRFGRFGSPQVDR